MGELRKLSKLLHKMSLNGAWTGGRVLKDRTPETKHQFYEEGWPKDLLLLTFKKGDHWSLGPEVFVGSTSLRLCIWSRKTFIKMKQDFDYLSDNKPVHHSSGIRINVVVFVGNTIAYPGGNYKVRNSLLWWPFNGDNWAVRIARQHRKDGGHVRSLPGARDKLLVQCQQHMAGKPVVEVTNESDPLYLEALAELEQDMAIRSFDKRLGALPNKES